MTTLAQVCAAHAAVAIAEYDQSETADQLRVERDRLEMEYREGTTNG
jgi:hypothetical protein